MNFTICPECNDGRISKKAETCPHCGYPLKQKSEVLFGKYSKIVYLFIGFILTSGVGAFIGSRLQYQVWESQYNIQILETDRAEATEVFKSVSGQLDKRYNSMERLLTMLKKGEDKEIITKQWELYRGYTVEYGQQRNQSLALIDWYFGSKIKELFAPALFREFRDLEEKVENIYKAYITARTQDAQDEVDYSALEKDLSNLREHIYKFNSFMIASIKEGKVGRFSQDRD